MTVEQLFEIIQKLKEDGYGNNKIYLEGNRKFIKEWNGNYVLDQLMHGEIIIILQNKDEI